MLIDYKYPKKRNILYDIIVFLSVLNASELFAYMAKRKIHDDCITESRSYMDRYAIHAIRKL